MKRRVLVILVAALASLISIPVGDSDFRITLGIVIMVVGIRIFRFEKAIRFSFLTGLAVCLTRIAYAAIMGIDITPALMGSYFLEIFFYIGYGIIYHSQLRASAQNIRFRSCCPYFSAISAATL